MSAARKGIYLTAAISCLLILTTYSTNVIAATSVIGNYQCERTEASGHVGSYTMTISDNSGNQVAATYKIEWDGSNGYPAFFGTGLIQPGVDNIMGAIFSDLKDANNFGSEVFEIKPDGSLQANWAVQTANQVGKETCTKTK